MVKCNENDCTKLAKFGYEYKTPLKCSTHRVSEPKMRDVMRKACEKCKTTRPNFNFAGEKPKYCVKCALPGMIDVENKLCKCKSAQPIYGLIEDNKILCCKKCKTPEMINLKDINKLCPCGIISTFGLENDEKPTCCKKCKTPEMKNIVDKMCIVCKITIPNYGLIGQKPTHCKNCKTDEMIDIKNKLCIICNLKRPSYGLENSKTLTHCLNCKTDEMIDINNNNKLCKSENCETRSMSKYDNFCAYCYSNLFPDSKIIINYKTKERKVVDFIRLNYPTKKWTFDKIVKNGCSQRRPDIFLDLNTHIIIIEIDENQHKRYDCSCENKRLMQLSADVNHKSIVFIRFNPDAYFNKDNKKIASCFRIDKMGALKINNTCEWNQRLKNLKDCINYWINNITDKTVEIIQLYYDQNNIN